MNYLAKLKSLFRLAIGNAINNTIGKNEFSRTQDSMPPRILVALARNDKTSEIIIRTTQILLFGLFLFLYLIGPTQARGMESQAPLVLGIYLSLSIIMLILAKRFTLSSWIIYSSIFLDMLLLTYLIWSYHIQYFQPAPFSLKAPSVFVYFILIAVRALRFDARYVLAAGLSATTCWSALVVYAIMKPTYYEPLTNDYVVYLTGNYVLVGAEILKIFSILIFTLILAIVVRRAYSFLASSVLEGQAAHDLSRFMPTDVATQIRDSKSDIKAGDGKRLDVAILSVDIRGFSKMVENLEPTEAMGILSDYQHQIVPLVHKHNGIIDKYMGDGIMITFGAVTVDEHYCKNAIACALDILASRKNWQGKAKEVEVNLAVTSGGVIYGAVGDGDRLEYTVIGAAVNRCAKLEKLNKEFASKGICDLATYELAKQQGLVEKQVPKTINTNVEGIDKKIAIVLLGSENE